MILAIILSACREVQHISWPLLAAGGVFFGLATAAQVNTSV